MNPLFNGNKALYCNVCSDYRHAMTKLNTVRMIADRLETYVKKRESKDVHNQPAIYVYNDCIHTHFMCGSCQMFHQRHGAGSPDFCKSWKECPILRRVSFL